MNPSPTNYPCNNNHNFGTSNSPWISLVISIGLMQIQYGGGTDGCWTVLDTARARAHVLPWSKLAPRVNVQFRATGAHLPGRVQFVPARLRLPLPYNLPFPPGNVNLLHTGNSNLSLPIYVFDFSWFAFDDCLARCPRRLAASTLLSKAEGERGRYFITWCGEHVGPTLANRRVKPCGEQAIKDDWSSDPTAQGGEVGGAELLRWMVGEHRSQQS